MYPNRCEGFNPPDARHSSGSFLHWRSLADVITSSPGGAVDDVICRRQTEIPPFIFRLLFFFNIVSSTRCDKKKKCAVQPASDHGPHEVSGSNRSVICAGVICDAAVGRNLAWWYVTHLSGCPWDFPHFSGRLMIIYGLAASQNIGSRRFKRHNNNI